MIMDGASNLTFVTLVSQVRAVMNNDDSNYSRHSFYSRHQLNGIWAQLIKFCLFESWLNAEHNGRRKNYGRISLTDKCEVNAILVGFIAFNFRFFGRKIDQRLQVYMLWPAYCLKESDKIVSDDER